MSRSTYGVVGLGVLSLLTAAVALGGTAPTKSAAVSSGSGVTKSGTAVRSFTDGGKTTVVGQNNVSVTVGETTGLRSLQQISVSWKGARPTAGINADVNSDLAQQEEYSFDLFECRGVDSDSAPAQDQISPETCWTQFADERFAPSYVDYPAWRSDSAATVPERQAVVDEPSGTENCSLNGLATQRWVPFLGADGTVYGGGPAGCAGQAPEASPVNLSTSSLPSNETFGITAADGTGSTAFTVFTNEDHASLGCSQTVACTLVAIPIEGISCDAGGSLLPPGQQPTGEDLADAEASCEATGNFKAGQHVAPGFAGQPAVDGSLWWSPSNWRNRISFPLSFAPADDACGLVSSQKPVDLYGSELMSQATTSWAPAFCLDPKRFPFDHVQTPEPQARSLLAVGEASPGVSGNVEAALSSYAPVSGYPETTVEAPIAVSGFGIAFSVDGADGNSVGTLRLDARLLAKLLTESYPDTPDVQSAYPASKDGTETLSNNPLNITEDPEFKALNPDVPPVLISDARATLLIVNSDSDVIQALTSYILADPEAKAFLQGDPDPWGMRVNPNYQGISLPVNNWPLLDAFKPTYDANNPCLQADPQPFLPLVAAPTSRLFNIAQDTEFAIAQSTLTCTGPGGRLVADGRQEPGSRFMLGLVSLGDATRDGLHLASLESSESASAPQKFTDDTGRTFVAPTTSSMAAAARLLVQDTATHTWPVDYSAQRSAADAYPGTMVVYAQVPTSGLSAADAAKYAQFLDYAAGPGQILGTAQGDLPTGYLPMTAANGLGGFAAYTREAAVAVSAQKGGLPEPPSTAASKPSGVVTYPGTGTGESTGGGDLGAGGPSQPGAMSGGSGAVPVTGSSDGTQTTAPGGAAGRTHAPISPAAGAQVNATPSDAASVGAASSILPVLVIVAVIGGGGASALLLRRGRP